MRTTFIGLGSNLGERLDYLHAAMASMMAIPGLHPVRRSAVYETEPVGKLDQTNFLNAVTEWRTSLAPMKLLEALHRIEARLGRLRNEVWGPRTIDLDILCMEGVVRRKSDRLRLPHPQLANRRFVLLPWADMAPDFFVDGFDRTVRQLLCDCPDQSKVVLYRSVAQWQGPLQRNTR